MAHPATGLVARDRQAARMEIIGRIAEARRTVVINRTPNGEPQPD